MQQPFAMVINMKRAIIIGAAGFVGGYLINYLNRECGLEVFATKLKSEKIENNTAQIHDLDIMDKEAIVSLLFEVRPDYIFHLRR